MKDVNETELSQKDFLRAKKVLDGCLAAIGELVEKAEEASIACCRANALDTRDQFGDLAAELSLARGRMLKARAIGGRIEGNGISRSGST